jgi:hypothetical protein
MKLYVQIYNIYPYIAIVKTKKTQTDSEPIIIIDNEKIPLDKLQEKIMVWQSWRDEYEKHHMVYRLNATICISSCL